MPVEVTTTGRAKPLHPEIEIALLRTAQEALANVAKHAHASRVGLTLSYMGDVVTLDVRDDGVGFDVRPKRPGRGGGFRTDRDAAAGQPGRRARWRSSRSRAAARPISARVPAIGAHRRRSEP